MSRYTTLVATLTVGVLLFPGGESRGAPPKKRRARPEPTRLVRALPAWTKIAVADAPAVTEDPGEQEGAAKKSSKKKTAKKKTTKPKITKSSSAKKTLFDLFEQTAECRLRKPFVIYFYWPEEIKPTTVEKTCALFEKKLAAAAGVEQTLSSFGRFICNAKELPKKVKVSLAPSAPRLAVYDPSGKRVYMVTRFPASEKPLVKKLETIKTLADKLVAGEKKKLEKAEKKKPPSKKKAPIRKKSKKKVDEKKKEGEDDES